MTPVVLKQSYYFRGSGCVTKGSAQRVTERGDGRREGTSAGQLLSGKRSVTGGGGASGGVTGAGDGRGARASTRPPPLLCRGVTGGTDSSHGDRCCSWRGEHRSQGRAQEHVSPEERVPALPAEDRRHYRRERAPLLPEGVKVGGDGEGERWCGQSGESSSYERGERRRYRRGERRRYRRGRAPALPEGLTASTTGGGKPLRLLFPFP